MQVFVTDSALAGSLSALFLGRLLPLDAIELMGAVVVDFLRYRDHPIF